MHDWSLNIQICIVAKLVFKGDLRYVIQCHHKRAQLSAAYAHPRQSVINHLPAHPQQPPALKLHWAGCCWSVSRRLLGGWAFTSAFSFFFHYNLEDLFFLAGCVMFFASSAVHSLLLLYILTQCGHLFFWKQGGRETDTASKQEAGGCVWCHVPL